MVQSKYILIPTYAPLYSMRECFGPIQGPLTKPTPAPIAVIGKLLLQSGKEKLEIYEVVRRDAKTWKDPVRLTLENYKLPYEQIAGIESNSIPAGTTTGSEPTQPTSVAPTVVKKDPEKIPEDFTSILPGQIDPLAELGNVDPNDLKIQTNAELAKKIEEEENSDLVVGHLDPEQFDDMSKENLDKLATDMGIKGAEQKSAEELAQELSEIPVQVSATDEVNPVKTVEHDVVLPENAVIASGEAISTTFDADGTMVSEAPAPSEEPVERANDSIADEIGDKRTMTKSERKRAAREAREREAALAAQNAAQNNN